MRTVPGLRPARRNSRCSLVYIERLDEIDESPQRCRQVPPSRVIEEGPGEAGPPGREHRLQFSAREVRLQPLLKQVDDADPCDRSIDRQVDGAS